MRQFSFGVMCAALLLSVYSIGSWLASPTANAQDATEASAETTEKIRNAAATLNAVQQQLITEKRYVPAIVGLNSFAITAGGVDAVADLESGRGVDPETYAGLHAGLGTEEVKSHLEKDAQERLLYKGKPVKMYPVSRINHLFQERSRIMGEGKATVAGPAKPTSPAGAAGGGTSSVKPVAPNPKVKPKKPVAAEENN